MLYVYTGTDREKARAALETELKKHKGARVIRLSDAHAPADISAALQGSGLFAERRIVVLDGALENEEMRPLVMQALTAMREAEDSYLILEEKVDAATKRALGKYAEKIQVFDSPKSQEGKGIFALKGALVRGDKKALWIGLQRELIEGKRPEAVHGFLFWAAKDALLRAPTARVRTLVARLAELPHEARRQGEELDYALERFVLSEI
ncbi:MAG: hypothetical protein U1D26_01930 [Patescibacteria group bacterium]|nr:hypothetical protein [Patescibacteria group bacterium]